MDLTRQILFGTALLSICAVLHVLLVSKAMVTIAELSKKVKNLRHNWRMPLFVGSTFAIVVFSHTIQVWIWAIAFRWQDAIPDWASSVYFSMVTYTTLGYGDITLGPEHRVFATFSAVTGLLTFGLSTAFLVGLVTRILSDSAHSEREKQ